MSEEILDGDNKPVSNLIKTFQVYFLFFFFNLVFLNPKGLFTLQRKTSLYKTLLDRQTAQNTSYSFETIFKNTL